MTEPQYILQIRVEQGRVYEHPLHGAGITLGRQPDNDVVLDHALVSDHHLRIEKAPSGAPAPFVVLDLGTRESPHAHSGTLYQGRRLLPGTPVPLSLDDPLTIGPYTLRVTARAAARIAAADASPTLAAPRSGRWGKAGFALALLSLLLNVVLLVKLGQVAGLGRDIAGDATGAIDKTWAEGITLEVGIAQSIPISASVPIDEKFDVHIQHNLVIDEVIQSYVDIPVIDRRVTLDIPVRATIPLDLVVPVHVQETVNVNEEILVDAAIPVHVDPEAVGLAPLLEKIEGWLARLRRIVWPF